jgi:copper homeostasis protein
VAQDKQQLDKLTPVAEESKVSFEVCAESAEAVRAALAVGADRVELCADLAVGGITPSLGLIEWAAGLPIAVHVLIRPRGGDFVYGGDERDIMLRDIATARSAGADGVVIGALAPAGTIDKPVTAALIEAARPASVTFHRAFDETADPLRALDDVVELGADRLLTSGGAANALDGAGVIADLVRRAAGRLAIMPGGGVTAANAAEILHRSGARELHFSGRGDPAVPLPGRLAAIIAAGRGVYQNGSGASRTSQLTLSPA